MSNQTPLCSYGFKKLGAPVSALLLVIFLAGAYFTWLMIGQADRELRADVLLKARWIAQAVNIESIQALKGNNKDLESPYYRRLKEQLTIVKSATPLCQSIYILGRRSNGALFYFLNSEPTRSKEYVPPGLAYKEASEVERKVFSTQTEAVEGSVSDQWGKWVTPLIPILDAETLVGTGESLAVLGMHVDAHTWNQMLLRAALPSVLLTLALTALLLSGSALVARRSRIIGVPHWGHYLEPTLAASAGLILTLFIAWMLHQQETHGRIKAFLQLATGRTSPITETLHDLLPAKLEMLAHFYEATPAVTPEKFSRFTECLTKNMAGQAWEWIPAIPAVDKARFEEEAQAAGLKGFGIWEKDGDKGTAPAGDRDVYYPVFLATPLQGNSRALGYDLGSETVRRTALEEAARTGLPTVTTPITLVQESGTQVGLLIYQPVFSSGNPRPLRGFALAVLRVETLLKGAGADQSSFMEISYLGNNRALMPLASARNGASMISATRPVFAFGKVFVVTAYAGPEFMRLHPVQAGWQAILTGLLLTAALAIVINVVLRRQEKLERVVFERTAALRESKSRFDQLAERSRTVNWEVDAQGLIAYVSHVVEPVLGYRPEELIGKKYVYNLAVESQRESRKAQFAGAEDRGGYILDTEIINQAKDGQQVWLSRQAIPIFNTDGIVRGYRVSTTDITERKRVDKELLRQKYKLQENYEKLRCLEASRDSIVHMVIHDMRTPLSVIAGYVDLLKTEASLKLNAKECRWLDDVSGSAETLMEMVSQLLDITQMESGEMPLDKKECALTDVVALAIEPHRILCGNRLLEFQELEPFPLICDVHIVRRIIGNLVGNAIKFTQESGKVRVYIQSPDSATMRVSVSDNGFGIPWASQDSVFDKFSQMDPNKKNMGFGLGLAFCRLAVEAHGGRIGLESEPGKGSTFWFELPRLAACRT